MNSYKYGIFAEYVVAVYLILKGYRILEKRYKTKVGEIDILAVKGRDLIAFEVKARRKQELTTDLVSIKQRNRIENALKFFILKNNKYVDYNIYYSIILYRHMFNFKIFREF